MPSHPLNPCAWEASTQDHTLPEKGDVFQARCPSEKGVVSGMQGEALAGDAELSCTKNVEAKDGRRLCRCDLYMNYEQENTI